MKTSTGNYSTGDWSTGNCSTGNYSTGDRSTGNYSTGNRSTGERSTGNWSTGNYSTGYRSTGERSTGERSTGNYSTGYRSTGNWSTSKYSSGHFSTEDYSGYGAFDKPCDPAIWDSLAKPDFLFFDLTKWIYESEMSEKEKQDNPTYKTTGGYLKVYSYHEAWRNSWEDAKAGKQDTPFEKQLEQLKALPNFDKAKFKQISGIDIDETDENSVMIDGVNWSISTLKELIKNAANKLK